MRRRRDEQRGFTLLEMMIVLALIGLIAGSIGTALFKKAVDARIKLAHVQVRELVGHVQQFMIMKERCPTVEDLVTEQYLRREPRDPWGTSIVVRCPGEHEPDPADVVSHGPDKKPDTADDIKSWTP